MILRSPKTCREFQACSHVWIDPTDPPISRTPYAPIIGPLRRQMKRGHTYRCQRCGSVLTISETDDVGSTP